MARHRTWFALALVGAVAAGAVAASRAATEAAPVAVQIAVRLDARGSGSFSTTGGVSDRGPARARRVVSGRRLRTTLTLTGRTGTLVIESARPCASPTGTWKVLSGRTGYAGAGGGGTSTERAGCARPWKASTATYRGRVTIPPAALGPRRVPRLIDADGSARAFFQGTFDRAGSMSGTFTLQQPTLTRDGTRYACRNAGASFTAKRQR